MRFDVIRLTISLSLSSSLSTHKELKVDDNNTSYFKFSRKRSL